MQNPKMRNCGDGIMRADAGSYIQLNDYTGYTSTSKTASYTLSALETGMCFDNTGAAGSVTFTLPTPKGGEFFILCKEASQTIVASCPAGVTINGASTLTSPTGATGAGSAMIEIFAISPTKYRAWTQGTWT